MPQFILRRAGLAAVLLLFASVLCFSLVIAAPGNVAVLIAEQRSGTVTKSDVEKVEKELGLKDPMPVRYARWLGQAAQGDLGPSLRTGEDIVTAFWKRLPNTGLLLLGAGIVSLVVGGVLGFAGALLPGSTLDRLLRAAAMLGISVPTFFTGALLILIFGVVLRWLPVYGYDDIKGWIMPWLTLGIFPGCVLSRLIRVSIEDLATRPFVITARSKGFGQLHVIAKEILPNLAPILVTAFGTQFGIMIFGAIVVEPMFSIQGVGYYFIEAAKFRDFTVVQACLLLFAAFFIVLNATVDVCAIAVNPKTRRI
ncbi:ABC transporter permease [Dongia sp.]|uniref:ABC transporter permease n=1 Tax=Dongia sp. TaxID=1977262 RepID=UPI003752CA88